MASCFNTTVADLEDELMILILDGQIQARIDSHNKVSSTVSSLLILDTIWRNKKVVWTLVARLSIQISKSKQAGGKNILLVLSSTSEAT